MKTPTNMDRYDFLSAIVLIVFASAVLIESLRMDRLEELDIDPYTAPGLVPGFLGVLLLACGIGLLIRAAVRGGWRLGLSGAVIAETLSSTAMRRMGLVLALSYGFAILLFGWLPFGLAAAIFIFAFIVALGPREFAGRRERVQSLAVALLIAVVAGYGIDGVFRQIFFVKLP